MKVIIQNLLIITIGICIGWLGFIAFGDAARICNIAYVSKEEILQLERARVNELKESKDEKNAKDKDLFFGKTNEALELIFRIARANQDRNTKVIFAETGKIGGVDVTSISESLHKAVIEKLGKSN